jgi:hypothetical protein
MNLEPATSGTNYGILQRWKREDSLKRASLGLRGVTLFFSLISFLLVASNNMVIGNFLTTIMSTGKKYGGKHNFEK